MIRVENAASSWPSIWGVDALAGARLLRDGPPVSSPALAIARAALRTNPRLSPIGALTLASYTVAAADRTALPPEFLAATLLQESAFDPNAISLAGAVGIAQFEPETAAEVGIDPFDPHDAIEGCAQLLASYLRAYASYDDPYGVALAAYNAGPGTVARYHGVPPYAETRDYITLIYERWGRIASYERRRPPV